MRTFSAAGLVLAAVILLSHCSGGGVTGPKKTTPPPPQVTQGVAAPTIEATAEGSRVNLMLGGETVCMWQGVTFYPWLTCALHEGTPTISYGQCVSPKEKFGTRITANSQLTPDCKVCVSWAPEDLGGSIIVCSGIVTQVTTPGTTK